jgi:glutathione peroxidase
VKKAIIAVVAAFGVAAGAIAFAQVQLPQRPPAPTAQQAQQRTAEVTAAVAEQERRFAAAPPVSRANRNTAYQFEFAGLWTEHVPMTAFDGDVVLVVNTASRCGFTPQYQGLQQIYNDYHARGFEVLGVPSANFRNQELASAQEIQQFCTLNYGATFPMTGRTDVIGEQRHPFYRWAEAQIGESAVPRWNFHKILIGRDGRVIAAFATNVDPASPEVRNAITAALARQR